VIFYDDRASGGAVLLSMFSKVYKSRAPKAQHSNVSRRIIICRNCLNLTEKIRLIFMVAPTVRFITTVVCVRVLITINYYPIIYVAYLFLLIS